MSDKDFEAAVESFGQAAFYRGYANGDPLGPDDRCAAVVKYQATKAALLAQHEALQAEVEGHAGEVVAWRWTTRSKNLPWNYITVKPTWLDAGHFAVDPLYIHPATSVGVEKRYANFRGEIQRISEDYCPDHPRDTAQALQEMRDALGEALDRSTLSQATGTEVGL